MAVGAGFMLDVLNIFNFSALAADWWPLAVIAAGILSFISNPRSIVIPLVVVATGVLLQLRMLDVFDFNIGALIWPSAIILFGLSLIFNRLGTGAKEIKDDETNMFAVFAGFEVKNKSPKFKGGKLTAVLGGIELDLRDADIKDNAELDIFAALGGIEIKVPEHWVVSTHGTSLLGGYENKTMKSNTKNAPTLIVRGTCILGGVEIKN